MTSQLILLTWLFPLFMCYCRPQCALIRTNMVRARQTVEAGPHDKPTSTDTVTCLGSAASVLTQVEIVDRDIKYQYKTNKFVFEAFVV